MRFCFTCKKRMLLVLIISLLLSIGMLVNVIIMNNDDNSLVSEQNSTEYAATVIRVIPSDAKTGAYGIIETKEYGNGLSLFGINTLIKLDDILSLQQGQAIYFRIPYYAVEKFEDTHSGAMVTLRTDSKEIVSLKQYNDYAKDDLVAPTIAGIVVSVLLLFISIRCILVMKGVSIFRKR